MALDRNSLQMAQQALQVYDREGESAMLSFIAVNIEPKQQPAWLSGHFHHVFKDDSFVERLAFPKGKNSYCFTTRTELPGNLHSEYRNSEIDPGHAIPFPPPNIPLIQWPDSAAVSHAVLKALEAEADPEWSDNREWPGNDPVLNEYQAHQAALPLMAVINQVMEAHSLPDHLLQELDDHLHQLAANAIQALKELDPAELQSLLDATQAAIKREAEE